MTGQRHTLRAAVFIVLERDGQVLLARRFQSSYYSGHYGLPAGHLDGGETPTEAMVREAAEEIGLTIPPTDLQFVHIMHRISPDVEYVDLYFRCTTFAGEPQNMEPEKCDELRWASYADLPEAMIPEVKIALGHIQAGVAYSEYQLLD